MVKRELYIYAHKERERERKEERFLGTELDQQAAFATPCSLS